ncbi:SPFH domain-containing protein [Ahrensia sp. R2A130]|uniref:SPFH domain-containing protein n=1 Tax=Ahrensia sp. R2A130 TaxID=744979 RepID=UPI0001E0C36D|nr:SPFH domain-containing protein [Ahrensia sp. R2A130]EFL88783.1 protein QmcA [Ahrensia sp. R2A130]
MDLAFSDIAFIGFAVLLVVIITSILKIVPQGWHYTVERLGRYDRTLMPGLNIIVPFIERIGTKMNMMEQVLDVPTQEIITKDNATCAVDGVTFFQVLDAAKASYEVSGLENAILNITMTNLRTVMGSMDLDELLSKRDEINTRILHVVDDAVAPWGIKMTRIEVKDIEPPADLVEAMGRQMKAERLKRASILEAEGEREAAILRAEGEKRGQVLEAEGQKEAAFLEAEAREREAAAEAEATRLVSQAIGEGNSQAINYFVAQKYTEALQTIGSAPNQKVIMMPMEATALIGSLAGMGEIAKEVFGDTASKPASSPRPARSRTPAVGRNTES